MLRRTLAVLAVLATSAGLVLLGGQGYLRAKAQLAAVLVDRAFVAHLQDGRPHRPWPWADLHPVACLEVARLGVHRPVLSGATGSSLAFGLGHVSGTALPGERGNSVIAAHRDSWGAFFAELRAGDEIELETAAGRRRYRVRDLRVVRREALELLEPDGEERLTLLTCWPFTGLFPSPWRYVVTAVPRD